MNSTVEIRDPQMVRPRLRLEWPRVSSTRKSRITGAVIAGALILFILIFLQAFVTHGDPAAGDAVTGTVSPTGNTIVWVGPLQLVLSVLLALAAGAVAAFRLEWNVSQRVAGWCTGVLYLLLPVASLTMMEYLGGVFTYDWSPLTFFRNYIFAALLFLGIYAIGGSVRISWFVINTIFYIFGVANHYVLSFRGTPLLPADLASVGTGLTVAGTYDYTPDKYVVLGTVFFAALLALGVRLPVLKPGKRVKLGIRLGSLAVIALFCGLLYTSDWFANQGIKPDFFNQARGYRNNGSLFHFWINTKYLIVSPPEGYSSDQVEQIVNSGEEQAGNDGASGATKDRPNIICIMDETLSDLSVVGDFTTNIDYMPYMRSLSDNTVKGHLYVSVYGAGTANSEFEFLTGDSLAFLPAGACAYESYVDNPMPSLVSSLGTLGYSKTAFHPYYGANWQRERVYPLLGFEDYISIEDLFGQENVAQYREDGNFLRYSQEVSEMYPDQVTFLRRYVSDEFDFRQVEQMYEERDESRPFFMFNVTMQNHSSYTSTSSNFQQEVWLTGDMEGKYPKADQYLSLVKRTDDAFQQLTSYFSQVNEPTIICIFGDHQPSIESGFYEDLFGKSINNLTLEERQKMYQTPFIIWANYEIEEQEIDAISANYLSTLLMEVAGLPLTDYQQYLSQLHTKIPVINANGYLGDDGQWYLIDDKTSPYANLVADYDKVQYNNLFDTENRVEDLYLLKKVESTATEP